MADTAVRGRLAGDAVGLREVLFQFFLARTGRTAAKAPEQRSAAAAEA